MHCRCLFLADPFYKWKRIGKSKQPYCFEVNEGDLFAFAGIWDRGKDASRNSVETCSILTTTPNGVTAVVHDRMPVILDPDSYDLWRDPGRKDVGLVSELLKPYNARIMGSYPVSTRVNQVVNDDEECSAPVQPIRTQSQLLFWTGMFTVFILQVVVLIIKRVVIAALLSAGLNLLADRCPTVRHCPATLLRDKLGYARNIRFLEYCACTLGKV
jgi:SOS response associated peptidase (SRAP)